MRELSDTQSTVNICSLALDCMSRPNTTLTQARHWVFDMDGTLTVSVHDLAAIRRALSVPERATSSVSWRDYLPPKRRPNTRGYSSTSGNWPRGCRLGILTRNARQMALVTLEAIGLPTLSIRTTSSTATKRRRNRIRVVYCNSRSSGAWRVASS